MCCCNSMSGEVLKNHLNLKVDPKSNRKQDEWKARVCNSKGLLFVDLLVNGKPVRAMVDTGATHNYLATTEVERLGLVLEKGVGKVKAINSTA